MKHSAFKVFGVGMWGIVLQVGEPAGGIPILVWILLALIALGLVIWMLSRRGESTMDRRDEVNWDRSPGMDEMRPQVVEVRGEGRDDLTVIEGIGPAAEDVLAAAGITTYERLADTNIDRLEEILQNQKMSLMDPETWPKQARLAAQGRMDELKRLQDSLKGGRTEQ